MRKYEFEDMRDWIATHNWPSKGSGHLDEKIQKMQHLFRWVQEELHSRSSSDPLVVTDLKSRQTEFWTFSFGGLRMRSGGETVTVLREQIPPRMFAEIIETLRKQPSLDPVTAARIDTEFATFVDYYNIKLTAREEHPQE
jgi:hypothetical protein